jgi:hypothetical protein
MTGAGAARRRGSITTGAARLALLVVLATVLGALRGWQPPPEPVTLTVDVRHRIGRVRPIWDETNMWKLGSIFGASKPDPARWWGRGWLRKHAPWVRYVRVLAALGGSYAPEIAPWCDHAVASPQHPDTGTQECGHDGVPGPAAREELIQKRDGVWVTDYTPFRTAIERVLRSGARPHVNLSASPSAFTGGVVDFSHYHWNAAPVQDFDGWARFVAGAFASVADLHPGRWRASVVNEPNCLTLVGWEGNVQHVGFSGTPADYARTFVTGARVLRSVAPGIALQAGNYVTSHTFPGEDNLVTYLRFLAKALAADGTVGWHDLRAMSLSLYETPDTNVYDLVGVRVARLEERVREAGLAPLPVKVDELDVHPVIVDAFDHATRQKLDRTAFAASWHAEAIRQFMNAGRIASVAPWMLRMFDLGPMAPYPKARVYQQLGLLAGQLRPVRDGAGIGVRRTGRWSGLPRLAVEGEIAPTAAPANVPGATTGSLGALATRTRDGFRLLVVHHQLRPTTDDSGLRRRAARTVRVRATNVAAGAYRVRVAAVGTRDARWTGTTTPMRWQDLGCRRAQHGTVEIAAPTTMDANTVWLYEATRRRRCAPAAGAAVASPRR